MDYLFRLLPKILFYPVYAAGWCGFLLCCAAVIRKRHLSGKMEWKTLLLLSLFAAAVLLLGFCPIRSARYIFMLAFPITCFAAVFFIGAAECFGRRAVVMLTFFILAAAGGNTLKVLHTDPTARFAEKAAEELRSSLVGEPGGEILLFGSSREIGRIAYNAGYAYRYYPYPVEDVLDLALLKEHFRSRYKTLILVSAGPKSGKALLPAPLFSIRKKNTTIHFYKLDLSAVNVSFKAKENGKNLFCNADLTQPMPISGIERIKTYFKDNPAVLKIVERQDFVWPYAWPFDHAGDFFPTRDFDLRTDKTPQGENAIHVQCRSELRFFHVVPFPMVGNYLLSMKLRLLEASEVAVYQYLKLNDGRVFFDEIKVYSGKAGSEESLQLPVCPGKRMRFSETERLQGSFFLFFALRYGNVQFSAFKLLEI